MDSLGSENGGCLRPKLSSSTVKSPSKRVSPGAEKANLLMFREDDPKTDDTKNGRPSGTTLLQRQQSIEAANALMTRYQILYRVFGFMFWFFLFFATCFIFLYFTLNDFALSPSEWIVSTVIIVSAIVASYIFHVWFECLSNQIILPEQYNALPLMQREMSPIQEVTANQKQFAGSCMFESQASLQGNIRQRQSSEGLTETMKPSDQLEMDEAEAEGNQDMLESILESLKGKDQNVANCSGNEQRKGGPRDYTDIEYGVRSSAGDIYYDRRRNGGIL
eukprot:CAMPEP_0114507354 /NCGR_PEP_ID=MMETSP0109-20121206/11964_1 /TAXON_ID=29199 /ORGANISM="Chlorarachnion reptans, Strain CCCM449" /LENGTH=276 /DNA_ID=CAMNT_0001686099 /DNA_START=1 /DNA_END=831 /DNA_ORIENTATION=-